MDPTTRTSNRPDHGPRSRRRNPIRFQWEDRSSAAWSFFCPLCRATRTLASRPGITRRHIFQMGLTTFIFMLTTWRWFEWKGIVAFVPLWAVFEAVFRSRQRIALKCPHCGFDPYLYLVDIQQAREQIENHWRKRFSEKGVPFPEKDKPEILSPRQSRSDSVQQQIPLKPEKASGDSGDSTGKPELVS